jgi:hypothetical protein
MECGYSNSGSDGVSGFVGAWLMCSRPPRRAWCFWWREIEDDDYVVRVVGGVVGDERVALVLSGEFRGGQPTGAAVALAHVDRSPFG